MKILRSGASKARIPWEEYAAHMEAGEKWCGACRRWLPASPEYFPRSRRSSGGLYAKCRPCAVRKARAWQVKNPERKRAADHRFRGGAAWRRLQQKHRDAKLAGTRRWRAENHEHRRSYQQEWRRQHPLNVRAHVSRRKARLKGAALDGRVSYVRILIRDCGRCGVCDKPVRPEDLTFDHIKPLARGGAHSMDNIQVAHLICNMRKWAK